MPVLQRLSGVDSDGAALSESRVEAMLYGWCVDGGFVQRSRFVDQLSNHIATQGRDKGARVTKPPV